MLLATQICKKRQGSRFLMMIFGGHVRAELQRVFTSFVWCAYVWWMDEAAFQCTSVSPLPRLKCRSDWDNGHPFPYVRLYKLGMGCMRLVRLGRGERIVDELNTKWLENAKKMTYMMKRWIGCVSCVQTSSQDDKRPSKKTVILSLVPWRFRRLKSFQELRHLTTARSVTMRWNGWLVGGAIFQHDRFKSGVNAVKTVRVAC